MHQRPEITRRLLLLVTLCIVVSALRSHASTDPTTCSRAASAVDLVAQWPSEAGHTLLPTETTVDRAEWVDGILHADLTIPADAAWDPTPSDIETLAEELARPFDADPGFAGSRVRLRRGPDAEYAVLDAYRPVAELSAEAPVFEAPLDSVPAKSSPGLRGFGGPTAHGAQQPAGALTGVTVYTTGGHGWTAGSNWYLQRHSALLGMNEDYGNLDMINYFVHYLFNAGATVVPLRPVGYQTIEIVLDNDDPGVTYTGSWNNSSATAEYYENGVTNSGIPYRWASTSPSESATARYTPTIAVTDFYPVYCFTRAGSDRVIQTYRISHSGGVTEVGVNHEETGNGWIWLGEYYLEAGGDNYVEITNASPDAGVVIADAIRFGVGMGDVVRPGPGSTSGYPRDEEAHRYWAESEMGNNAVGFSSSIWDGGGDDLSDNHGCAARMARQMNRVPTGGIFQDRWKRVYLAFHTNAAGCVGGPPCSARGSVGLITGNATTNQQTFAHIVSEELDNDLKTIESELEHTWNDSRDTYTGGYGSISTSNNSDEFDATIIELAFHDNQQDAELLRDCRVRAAMARSQVQGIIRFLHGLSGSQVPLAFAPDTPRNVQVEDNGDGTITLSWIAPLADGARGDPATGYVVYESPNGYGFGNPTVVGNVLTATLPAPPTGVVRYYRVAATNPGGESMPTEVLAVRRPPTGEASVLIVNGFDRLRRQQNHVQTFTFPPAYAGDQNERQIWRKANAFDYVVQHATAIAEASTLGFASCSNEAVAADGVNLDNYDIVVWIGGEESTEDETLSAAEQNRLANYLDQGGALFISGSEIGYDLDFLSGGRTFYEERLGADYVGNDAGTYNAAGTGFFSDIPAFNFAPGNGAPYNVEAPDRITPQPGAETILAYSGGSGGTAGILYEEPNGIFRTITLAFPFETITAPAIRTDLMQRALDYLGGTVGPIPGDLDHNGQVDLNDYDYIHACIQGPGYDYAGHICTIADVDGDNRVDLRDFAIMQQNFTGP